MPGRKRIGRVTDTWSDIKKARKCSKTKLILFSGGPVQYSLPTCLLEQNLSTLKHPESPELVKHYMLCQAESEWDG